MRSARRMIRSRRWMSRRCPDRCWRRLIVIVILIVAVRSASVFIVFVLVGRGGLVIRIDVRMIPIVMVSTASPSEAATSPPSATSPELARP